MDKSLMYLSVLQIGFTYAAGFATSQYVATHSSNWGFVAVATTIFLLMSSKYETYRRIEALLGPLPESTKDSKNPAKTGAVGFAVTGLK